MGTGQREVRSVWNNAMRINHQNFSISIRNFAPTTVLTKFGIVPISAARQSSLRPATPVSVARPINIVVNSLNTAKGNIVTSAVGEQGINVVKSSAHWVWRPKIKIQDHGNPQDALKDTWIFDSGCSRQMTGNNSYLKDYQEYDGGFVAFASSSKGEDYTQMMFELALKSKYDAKFLNTIELSCYCWVELCTASTKVSAARFS
ncbi:hypothetical protein Tco_0809983 [Tanacetum coccineum]